MSGEVRTQIRMPAFAGMFYPSDPASLRQSIRQYLHGHAGLSAGKPRILIVPHAGYMYSGKVAGAGFAQVRDCSTVILLGVSHHFLFDIVAAYSGAYWRTPLGQVAVDCGLVNELVDSSAAVSIDNDAHEDEHGLEVQVPFLQQVLADFRIVPLLLGDHRAICEASTALVRLFDDQTLLVVSSDLSHYPDQADAERVDHQTIEAILSMNPEHFRDVLVAQLRQGIPGLSTCACGAAAIEVALRVAQTLHFRQSCLLAYQNSGMITGDSRRVVGYTSIMFA